MERTVICIDCLSETHTEHDLEGCTYVIQGYIRDGGVYKELCSCKKTPLPLKVSNVLKLKLKDPSH